GTNSGGRGARRRLRSCSRRREATGIPARPPTTRHLVECNPMRDIRKTVCNRDCPDACSIVAHVEDGRVVQLRGDPAHPVTGGFLCWRTNNFLPLQYHPERLTTPLLRGNPVSWDEALDFAARELTRIRAGSGPQAIFHYRRGGPLGSLKHLTDYFFSEFGTVTAKRGYTS